MYRVSYTICFTVTHGVTLNGEVYNYPCILIYPFNINTLNSSMPANKKVARYVQ